MKENKGITLIALIITIVVLLILAVVTISAVNEGGVFQYANNAATKYNAAAIEENTMLTNYLSQMREYDSETGGQNTNVFNRYGETYDRGSYKYKFEREGNNIILYSIGFKGQNVDDPLSTKVVSSINTDNNGFASNIASIATYNSLQTSDFAEDGFYYDNDGDIRYLAFDKTYTRMYLDVDTMAEIGTDLNWALYEN